MDTLTGTAGDDVFIGFVGTGATLGLADSINGGGGVNTLRVFSDNTTTLPTAITNIQNLLINDTAHESRNIATSDLAGVSSLTLQSGVTIDGATVTVTLGSGDSVTFDGVQDVAAGDSAATVADGGISIAQAATLTSVAFTVKDTGAATANTATTIGLAGTGVATATLTATGTASHINLLNAGAALTTVNINGASALTTYTDLPDTVTTVNGAAATGVLSLDLGGTSVRSVTGGTGNDIFRLGADYVGGTSGATRDIIDGGNGTDSVSITTAIAAAIAANQSNLTSIETIIVSNASGAVDMRYFVGSTGLTLAAGRSAASTTVIVNSGTTVTLSADDGEGVHTLQVAGTGTSDSVTLVLASGVDFIDATADDSDVFTGIETLNIQTQSTIAGTVNLINSALTMTATASTETMNISGKTAITFTGQVTADAINGAGLVGAAAILTLTGGTASAAVITGGEAADALLGSSAADIISGGGGADTITSSGGTDTVTGGAGADIFYFAAAAHVGNVVTDMTAGTGGDVIRIDDSGFGDLEGTATLAFKSVAAGLTAAAITDNVILVSTAVAGTSAAAVEDAVNLAGGGVANFSGVDVMYVIFNSTTGKAEMWNDLDGNSDDNGGNVTLTATFDNIVTLAGLNLLVAANFNVVA